ncbi:MAG TPA: FAD binding domain-containing protein [Clostridia bacterium]|nr:FAD binding domain-containing protein [Clostridia bacterium]HRX42056.1 FAD binding domain-containing protein [Clostridia bacterium]
MKINNYVKVSSVEEAYSILEGNSKAAIIAGGAWLRLTPTEVDEAVDLSGLGLDSIDVVDGFVEIGSMTTLRQVEKSDIVKALCNGIVCTAVEKIMGVTVRNIATIGGTISGKYGFSDLITPLMVLDTELEFYKRGRVSLVEFMDETAKSGDILLKVRIPMKEGRGWYETIKITAIDFPILNAAVTRIDGKTKIAVGSRPYKAVLAEMAMAYVDTCGKHDADCAERAAATAAAEIKFGSNSRGSAAYRKKLCEALVKRGLREVMS